MRRLLSALCLLVVTGCSTDPGATVHPSPTTGKFLGTVAGARYLIEVPPRWNGTLLLYSHGYAGPGTPELASDSGDETTAAWLRGHGYALAGTSYGKTGWAVEDAFPAQVALLDEFSRLHGKPRRTIAWGHSLGGIVTAGLVQLHPERFDAALPMCGVLGGAIANWNGGLDESFVIKTLLDPAGPLQLVQVTDPGANLNTGRRLLAQAAASATGRARVALAAAVGDVPGWVSPVGAEPATDDYTAIAANQAEWLRTDMTYSLAYRAELEARAAGNPSWNTGVDYSALLATSPYAGVVRRLYAEAGASLDLDLATLAATRRISADPAAVDYLDSNITFNGRLPIPVLTLHTVADGLVVAANEAAYAASVSAAGNTANLRQLYVHRAGHCIFSPAEQVTAFKVLFARLDSGRWDPLATPEVLNRQAQALGTELNSGRLPGIGVVAAAPQFTAFDAPAFPRPFDSRSRRP